ncbi:transketolase [Candidatus Dependentiae bacterium]|nr:transketolase [Candidatus Dependentiae bacterium]
MTDKILFLKNKSKEIRLEIVKMTYRLGGGHIGPALSANDILTVLYYNFLNIMPDNPLNENRDRFILSKGHACFGFYYILSDLGFFNKNILLQVNKDTDTLGSHPEIKPEWGIEITTGSLGHGLSIGCGIALSAKINDKKFRTVVLMGDGECQEGSVWEAAMFAKQQKLDNLIGIVDYNKLQAIQPISEAVDIFPLSEKWKSFGWSVQEIDGHNIEQIIGSLEKIPMATGKPSMIIAHTVKGKGVSYMENKPLWHYRSPDQKEYEIALTELS